MKRHHDGNANDELGDRDLQDREEKDKRELLRLEKLEPGRRESTKEFSEGSGALMHAWERWKATDIAMRLRGLLPKSSNLR